MTLIPDAQVHLMPTSLPYPTAVGCFPYAIDREQHGIANPFRGTLADILVAMIVDIEGHPRNAFRCFQISLAIIGY